MSDEEKNKGEYEKPESHGEGDELEGVAGGVSDSPGNDPDCMTGASASAACRTGPSPKSYTCTQGGVATGR